MFSEYDVVELTEDIDADVTQWDLGGVVKAGTQGTIVLVYPGSPDSYEVEFFDNNNQTIAVKTVSERQIRSIA